MEIRAESVDGTVRGHFLDYTGKECVITQTIDDEECLWITLGLDYKGINGQMYLDRDRVAALIPLLQFFVKTGRIEFDSSPEQLLILFEGAAGLELQESVRKSILRLHQPYSRTVPDNQIAARAIALVRDLHKGHGSLIYDCEPPRSVQEKLNEQLAALAPGYSFFWLIEGAQAFHPGYSHTSMPSRSGTPRIKKVQCPGLMHNGTVLVQALTDISR